MPKDPSVDIIIPLYNEDRIIKASVERLVDFLDKSAFPYRYQIVLVNNASTDNSAVVCAALAAKFSQVTVLDLGKKGKGLAIRTAWSKSRADILSFMDADLSSDLSYFRPLIDEVAMRGADISIGNRLGAGSQVFSKRFMRKAASFLYNLMARWLLGTPFEDHQCGFKAMKKSSFQALAPELKEDGFFFDTELLALAVKRNFVIKEIDIVWHDSDESKVSIFSDSFKMFLDIVRLRNRIRGTA